MNKLGFLLTIIVSLGTLITLTTLKLGKNDMVKYYKDDKEFNNAKIEIYRPRIFKLGYTILIIGLIGSLIYGIIEMIK